MADLGSSRTGVPSEPSIPVSGTGKRNRPIPISPEDIDEGRIADEIVKQLAKDKVKHMMAARNKSHQKYGEQKEKRIWTTRFVKDYRGYRLAQIPYKKSFLRLTSICQRRKISFPWNDKRIVKLHKELEDGKYNPPETDTEEDPDLEEGEEKEETDEEGDKLLEEMEGTLAN